jgi:signal peptidase II
MKYHHKILLVCLLSIAFIGCDRITKNIAKDQLKDKPAISYFHDNVRLMFVENTGAFLSMGADWSGSKSLWLLTIAPILFLLALMIIIMRKAKQLTVFEMMAFILVFSGGMGNMIDRLLFDRHVADFINLGIGNLRTGVFNVADIYVTTGVVMLVYSFVKKTFEKQQAAV